MAAPGVAVPGSVVAIGSQASPAGPQGIQGPTAVSGDAGNTAMLGTDNLLYVPATALATTTKIGSINKLSGNTTDFLDGTNAFQPLAPAVQPTIWSARLRSYNAIGNPTFEVDQRNVGAVLTNPTSGTFIQDRWSIFKSASLTGSVNFGLQNVPMAPVVVPGTNFGITQNFQRYTVGTAQVSLGAGDFFGITQYVEGPRWRELALDVHSTEVLVRSSIAGTFALRLRDPTTTHSLVKLCTIAAANTWTLVQLQNLPVWVGTYSAVPGGIGYNLDIFLACGSTYLAVASASWQNGDIRGVTGMGNFLATAGATFDIAFVQHEPGPLCTTLIDCPFTQNYDDCLRYFCKSYDYDTVVGALTFNGEISFAQIGTNVVGGTLRFPKAMAKVPIAIGIYNPVTGAGNSLRMNGVTYAITSVGELGKGGFDAINTVTMPAVSLGATAYFQYTADTGW